MRHWTLSTAIGAAIFSASSGSASPVRNVVSDIYVLDQKRSDDAFQAIESAIADIAIANRSRARMRLRKSIAVDRLRISSAGNRIGITYDAKAPIVVWMGEEPVKWKLIEGLVFQVSAKADGESISLTFIGEDSERTTTYRSVGQDLVENTTMMVPLISKPIVYTRVYNRTN